MKSTSRVIRLLRHDDIDSLQALDEQAHGTGWSHRTFIDEIDRDDRIHLVADVGGHMVGHASSWIDGSSGRVTNVAVDPDHAGMGHASALLIDLLTQVLERPSILNLQLEVRPSNRRAQRLYSRFGFVPVGIERGFYDRSDELGSTDAVVMAVADVCSSAWRQRLEELAVESEEGAAA